MQSVKVPPVSIQSFQGVAEIVLLDEFITEQKSFIEIQPSSKRNSTKMKILLQRVASAKVSVANEEVGAIGRGILILLGIEPGDDEKAVDWGVNKILKLRVFPDDEGKMNRSIMDIQGQILVVSQFTLCADLKRGTRPSFIGAAPPEQACQLYELFAARASAALGRPVPTGRFGAEMQVELVNDGPMTLWITGP